MSKILVDLQHLKGSKRVAYFQRRFNAICAKHKIPLKPLVVDGDKGPNTMRAIRHLKRCFGVKPGNVNVSLDNKFIAHLHLPFSPTLFQGQGQWDRGLDYRNHLRRQHAANMKRQAAERKAAAKAGGRGGRAAAAARKSMGYHEDAGRPNRAPWLDGWVRKFGASWMYGQPYCGLGMWIWWLRAGWRGPADSVSTVAIANRAHRRDRFKAVAWEDMQVGDWIVFHFGSGGPKHVGMCRARPSGGMVLTYEANTSPGNAGSQANGGGNYPRARSRGLVHTVARPI